MGRGFEGSAVLVCVICIWVVKLVTVDIGSTKKLSQNAICHSERSEESLISASQTLRFAQGDSFEIVS